MPKLQAETQKKLMFSAPDDAAYEIDDQRRKYCKEKRGHLEGFDEMCAEIDQADVDHCADQTQRNAADGRGNESKHRSEQQMRDAKQRPDRQMRQICRRIACAQRGIENIVQRGNRQ